MVVGGLFLFVSRGFAQNITNTTNNQNNMFSQGQQKGQGGPGMGAQRNGQAPVPPQFAIDACTGKSEGTACEMSTPNGTKAGVCASTPDKKYFACKPNDMNRSSQGQQKGQGGEGRNFIK